MTHKPIGRKAFLATPGKAGRRGSFRMTVA